MSLKLSIIGIFTIFIILIGYMGGYMIATKTNVIEVNEEIELVKDGKYLKSLFDLDYEYRETLTIDTIIIIDIKNGYIFYQTEWDRISTDYFDNYKYTVMKEKKLRKYIVSEVK